VEFEKKPKTESGDVGEDVPIPTFPEEGNMFCAKIAVVHSRRDVVIATVLTVFNKWGGKLKDTCSHSVMILVYVKFRLKN